MSEIERVQYKLMLPAQLKAALEESAHDHRRSLSAEIIQRLYDSLDAEAAAADEDRDPTPEEIAASDELYRRLDEIVERTIRLVRDEERNAGLRPLDIDPKEEQ